MRIHVIQTGTVAIKQVQRHSDTSGNPVVNILRDPTWTEPLPIYAFVIEHPEGLSVVDTGDLMLAEQIDGVASDRAAARQTLAQIHTFCRATPTVYLPAHDPDTPDRLASRQVTATQSP